MSPESTMSLVKADAIVLFGAAVRRDGPSPALARRTARAAQLFAEGWAPVILCSGGVSDGRSEAQAMRELLIGHGVPAGAIIPDDGGDTTRGTLRSVTRFGAGRWQRVIAVSSPYHLPRIGAEARRQRVDAILCPAPRGGTRTWRLALHDARQSLRELVARPAYAVGWHLDRLARHDPLRRLCSAWREVAARLSFLFVDADAVAEASDTISAQIKRRVAEFSDTKTVLTPASGLQWPLSGVPGDRFGLRHRRLHAGIDIRAPYGAVVSAAAAGTLLYAGNLGPYGNLVVVDHGGGLTSVYAHLAGYVVAEREAVAAGQCLAYVGETGRSFGPHLHFEVRVHGSAVDPAVFLPPASAIPGCRDAR